MMSRSAPTVTLGKVAALRRAAASPLQRPRGWIAGRRTGSCRIEDNRRMSEEHTLGTQFARALAAKDRAAIGALLAPQIDFRGLTPKKVWDASDAETVLTTLLGNWFEPEDEIVELQQLETDDFADRERVGYRFAITNPEGGFVVEQQAYLSGRDGRIEWMRVVCSGYRPVG
jgi:hypothetical protein